MRTEEPVPSGGGGRTPPSRPWWRREWPILAVLVVVLAGLVLSGFDYVRKGPALIGCGALLGALLRLVLSDVDAGLLAVRRRGVDVAVLSVLGVAAIVLTLTILPVTRR